MAGKSSQLIRVYCFRNLMFHDLQEAYNSQFALDADDTGTNLIHLQHPKLKKQRSCVLFKYSVGLKIILRCYNIEERIDQPLLSWICQQHRLEISRIKLKINQDIGIPSTKVVDS